MLWGLKPVEQKAAHGLAYDRLRRLIHLGVMLPEERMASERRLAEQIGISRVTLREALSALEAEGYVVIRRGATGGAFVAKEGDLIAMAENQHSAQRADALRVQEFREMAEREAALWAALRRTPADLKHLESALAQLQTAASLGAIRGFEAIFHLGVAQASGNPLLASSIEDAMAAMFLPFPTGDVAAEAADSFARCTALADAIRDRDQSRAGEAMADLLASYRARVPMRRVA